MPTPRFPKTRTNARDTKANTPLPQKDKALLYVENIVSDSEGNRTTWVENQAKFNKMRMRTKKTKTFPFIGCSNIKMPTAEIKVRKVKAAIFNTIFGIRPIVQATPPPSGSYDVALKIEKFLDHLIMERMSYLKKAIITIDQELEQGFYLNMPYWDLEITDRQEYFDRADFSMDEVLFMYDGNTTPEMIREFLINHYDIDMNEKVSDENESAIQDVVNRVHEGKPFSFFVQDIIKDQPEVDLVSPERCFVPSDAGFDPQTNHDMVIESYIPLKRLQVYAKHFGWDMKGVEHIGSYLGKKSDGAETQKETNKDAQEGIDRLNSVSNLVRIWTYLGWYDINNDGVEEKAIMYFAPDFNKTLKKQGLPFYNGKFNIVKFFYELRDDRWYAHRGLVEMMEDIIKEIDIQHNMKIDQQTIRNAPMYLYRAGQVNPNLIQCIPNQAIPVRGVGALRESVDVLNNTNPNVEYSYDKEQQILEGKLEELTGQTDYNLQSQINRRQPRTLGEVQLQAQNAQQVFSLDAGMHTEQFSELFNFIWDLWCQYGSDEYEFNYFGQNGWEKIKLSKEEVQGKYRITVRGNDRNTNPLVRLQKAEQILLAAKDPVLTQAGVITPPQMIESLKRFYQYLEVDNWESLVNLQWQPPQPPPSSAIIKPDFNGLTDGEQMQVIASAGVKPDVQGRMMAKQQELLEVHADHTHQMSKSNKKEETSGK